jgi:hypothetical protein
MKRKWQVHRSVVEYSDGQRRWDTAYQLLLRWAMESNVPLSGGTPSQENEDEDRAVYSSINALSNAKSNH